MVRGEADGGAGQKRSWTCRTGRISSLAGSRTGSARSLVHSPLPPPRPLPRCRACLQRCIDNPLPEERSLGLGQNRKPRFRAGARARASILSAAPARACARERAGGHARTVPVMRECAPLARGRLHRDLCAPRAPVCTGM